MGRLGRVCSNVPCHGAKDEKRAFLKLDAYFYDILALENYYFIHTGIIAEAASRKSWLI